MELASMLLTEVMGSYGEPTLFRRTVVGVVVLGAGEAAPRRPGGGHASRSSSCTKGEHCVV